MRDSAAQPAKICPGVKNPGGAIQVVQWRSDALLAEAVAAWERGRQAAWDEQRPPRPVRLFDGLG
jgi:hypothetical protein